MNKFCCCKDLHTHVKAPHTWPEHLSSSERWVCGCAARQNFNVVRMFGFPVQRGFNLQTSAGVYNEQVCQCLNTLASDSSIVRYVCM